MALPLSFWIRIIWELRTYWLAVNAIEISLFCYDKKMAEMGGWRISENTLLGMAMLGGTPGAFLASRFWRHKYRKKSFMTKLGVIAVVQVVLILAPWLQRGSG